MKLASATRTPWWIIGAAGVALAWTADAQPIPYASLPQDGTSSSQVGGAAAVVSISPLSDALRAARSGDVNRAEALKATLTDPVAGKLVTWTEIDSSGTMLGFGQLEPAGRDLQGWPREARRRAVTEKALELGGTSPTATIAWFGAREPQTAQGALALAAAYQAQNRAADAQALVRRFWRERSFDADVQARMLARFGTALTPEDHARRLQNLLYGQAGPATQAMIALVDADHQALARARLALRADRNDASALVSALPASVANDAGLAFDRARYYRKRSLDTIAVGYLAAASADPPGPDAASAVWTERRALMGAALRSGDTRGAYAAASAHGLGDGVDYTEAEFFAGWIALSKLHDPELADPHFANVQRVGLTPVTLSRALYWRGRAAAARGDQVAAQSYWREGGAYYTAFYGQLSAERAGVTRINLGVDPTPSADDRARFDARETVRAARLLAENGQRELFSAFCLSIAENLDTVEEEALLVDLARSGGDPGLANRVARVAITRGLYLPERGWPVLAAPLGSGLPEPAFTLAIVRQESAFQPTIRSAVGARGLMQLMPSTAAGVARRQGLSFSTERLDEPDYNLRLGSAFLGQLTDDFSGSYVLAAAGYNAGPGRAGQWASDCGDPRQSSIDPADFIECIPYSETRNYVMRVLESVEVYRARLNGGSAPLTLIADLHRGGYTPAVAGLQTASQTR